MVLCVDHAEWGGTLRRLRYRRRPDHVDRPERATAAGGIVVAVAGVEPNFITGADTENTRIDASVFRIDDYIIGRCSDSTSRAPDLAGRIEDRIAADK